MNTVCHNTKKYSENLMKHKFGSGSILEINIYECFSSMMIGLTDFYCFKVLFSIFEPWFKI